MDSGRISSMAAKNDIDITIGGKTFTLSGVESEAYLREVASYLNAKLKDFSDDAAYWKLPNDMRNVMLQLNLADDYFKERSRAQELEDRVQELGEHRDQALQELEEMQAAAQASASRISVLEADAAGLRDKAQRAAAAENSANKRFGAEKSRADKLTEELDALRRSKAESDKAVERLRKELSQTRETMQGELNRTKTGLEQQLAASEAQRKKEVQDLQSSHRQEMNARNADSAKALKDRESSLQRELADTRKKLSGQLDAAKAEAENLRKSLSTTEEENKKLKSQLDIALLNGENIKKKLAALEKGFADKLAADTEQYRREAQNARDELEKTREDLTVLQEQENSRLQAAARVRSTMQELVQQYGRFGQSLEEAAGQLRTLEE